jgi:hypothetical protein
MSEKIYAWLLRLYPTSFQKAYGAEALQIFRDRARDEKGLLAGLRLWLDLLGDLAISVPRCYRTFPSAFPAAKPCAGGAPSFLILEDEPLSFGSLFYGGIASVVFYGFLLFLVSHGGSRFLIRAPETPQPVSNSQAMAMPKATVVFSCSPAHPAPGSMITLTATVVGAGTRPTPTGQVRFFDGSTALTTLSVGKLDQGAVTVNAELPFGATHSLWALYYGDANYRAASSLDE